MGDNLNVLGSAADSTLAYRGKDVWFESHFNISTVYNKKTPSNLL